ncbi:MAG: hypothetical protein JXA66_03795 [Oligoflexia bacterium]|nr:hypothetical protein [Oligoflexia bacterium]
MLFLLLYCFAAWSLECRLVFSAANGIKADITNKTGETATVTKVKLFYTKCTKDSCLDHTYTIERDLPAVIGQGKNLLYPLSPALGLKKQDNALCMAVTD